MRGAIALTLLLPLAAASAEEVPWPAHPLLNVELVDAKGVSTKLSGFYRLSGEFHFDGYLGAAEIRVPYERIREILVTAPAHPGGRPRARLVLRSGGEVDATYDEREGEILFSGFAHFGRVTVYFRDIRHLKILGRTRRSDLPVYGAPTHGVDTRLVDSKDVATELVGFRRATGHNVIPGVRGSTSIAIPLRIVRTLSLRPAAGRPPDGVATLESGKEVRFQLPGPEEQTVYVGDAPFGRLRIRLHEIRALEVHRSTPLLRDVDPLEAAGLTTGSEGESKR